MASSKLEYLQRYLSKGSGGNADQPKAKKKRRKQPSARPAVAPSGSLRIVDEDHAWERDAPSRAAIEDKWEMDAADEEAPVIVADGEEIDPQDLPVIVNADEFSTTVPKKTAPEVDASPPRRERRRPPRADDDDEPSPSPPHRRRRHTDAADDSSPPRRSRRRSSDAGDDTSPPRRGQRRRAAASDSDQDASPPRRGRRPSASGSPSPPQGHRRPVSDAEDASPPRRRRSSHSRSASRDRVHRRPSSGRRSPSPPPRRSRHRDRSPSPSNRGRDRSRSRERDRDHRRRRRRSRSISPRRGRGRSHSTSPRRRATRSSSPSRPRRSPISDAAKDSSPPRRRRPSTPPRSTSRANKDDKDGEPASEAAKPQTGPKKEDTYKPRAGLFTAEEFADDLKRKQAANDLLRGAKAEDMGQNADTVYRDRKGRKLDMLNEMARQQEIVEGKRKRAAQEEYEWGTGRVQKEEKQSQQELLDKMKRAPFARHEDDEELERMRRERVRAFDPMNSRVFQEDAAAADHLLSDEDPLSKKKRKKLAKKKKAAKASTKPKYAGPPAPPNRFGIQPGYRWDGVVRGTGWEEKVMLRHNTANAATEAAYRYAVADM